MMRCIARLLLMVMPIVMGSGSALALSKYEERLNELAEGIISEAAQFKARRLAVFDFTDPKGAATPVGQFLAEEVSTQLLVVGELTVVDRQLLKTTMARHGLERFDVSQAKAVRDMAKALHVDLFVVGSFVEIPEGVQVTTKLIRPQTMQAAGAARAIVPKAGPLLALLKQPAAAPPVAAPKEPDRGAALKPTHANHFYAMTVTDITEHDQRIALELTLENRSSRDIKIHCQLQDTYVKDETGGQWKQAVSDNRDGLCMRGVELAPGHTTHVALLFPIHSRRPGSKLSLHFHEMSPRRDLVYVLDGLILQSDGPASSTAPGAP